jgi:hypothetical protein
MPAAHAADLHFKHNHAVHLAQTPHVTMVSTRYMQPWQCNHDTLDIIMCLLHRHTAKCCIYPNNCPAAVTSTASQPRAHLYHTCASLGHVCLSKLPYNIATLQNNTTKPLQTPLVGLHTPTGTASCCLTMQHYTTALAPSWGPPYPS